MSSAAHAGALRFERLTVYVALASEAELLPFITAQASSLASECLFVTRKDIVAHGVSAAEGSTQASPACQSTTLDLLKWWRAEEADVYTRDVNNTVLFMNAAEVLITDKNAADGAVAYALYHRQMPVLSLAATQLPARSSLHQLLYTATTGVSLEEQKAAILQFLSFPAERGTYSVASTCASASTARTADTETIATVQVNVDGYPIQVPHAAHGALLDSQLPPPPTLFANVLAELRDSGSAGLDVLRRRNPILPGVLEIFHRYQNRGVVRAMLHRGYRVEVAPEAVAESLKWVRTFVALTEEKVAAPAEKMAKAETALAKFESHWLELPLAQPSP